MAAVCEAEHFAEIIKNRPENRALLMAQKPDAFIACMNAWRAHFLAGIDLPLIGTSEADLRSLPCRCASSPATTSRTRSKVAELAVRLLPDAELHKVMGPDVAVDVLAMDQWQGQGRRDGGCVHRVSEVAARKLKSKRRR